MAWPVSSADHLPNADRYFIAHSTAALQIKKGSQPKILGEGLYVLAGLSGISPLLLSLVPLKPSKGKTLGFKTEIKSAA